jgi:replication factor C small subunit
MNGGIRMLWTEKYRPKRLNEIVGQEHFVLDAENWVENKDMPNLLLHGNSGIGKTACALALSNTILGADAETNFFEVNASDDRRLETVRTRIKEIAQSGAMGNVPFRIILLDEMGGMTTDAQNALRRIMERYSGNVRFIITCNDRNRIIYALQSRCANYHFKPLSLELVNRVVKQILKRENKSVDEEQLKTFIYSFNGDLRRTLTELQASISAGIRLNVQVEKTLQEYEIVINEIMNKNANEALSNLHNLIYAGRSPKEICIGLHDFIIASDMDSNTKLKFLRVIGEGEWRATTMTNKLLVSWMVGQLI